MSAEHCQFFVVRKKRYCRMTLKSGNKYCGEHLMSDVNYFQKLLGENERIQCPLDPSHSCYKSKLPLHLKKCNAKRKLEPKSYIEKNYNVEKLDGNLFRTPLSEIDQEIVNNIILKINKAYENVPEIPEETLTHSVLEEELKNSEYGNDTKKHLVQNTSLLAHLCQANLVCDNTCYIDFGAGKGKLTYWLAQMIKDHKDSSVLLIDRSNLRHQWDNKLKNNECLIKTKRIRADIADLKLCGLEEFSNQSHKVAVAKHLCGAATDFTLQCLANAMRDESQQKIKGLIIAFCCHHRCEYNSYVGKEFLERNGFSAEEFPILCSIATWATCGFNKTKNPNVNETSKEKECIGRKVKNLMNWGRVNFLRKLQFNCRLVQYVSAEISLENICIIAVKNNVTV